MMNPTSLFKMKGLLDKFNKNHPKVMPFLNTVNAKGITPGTIIEAKVTFPDDTEYVTNIKVNEEDLALVLGKQRNRWKTMVRQLCIIKFLTNWKI